MRQGLITLSHLIFLLEKSVSVTRELNSCGTLFLFAEKTKERWLEMRKGAKRLNFTDRQKIESMLKSGAKVVEVAQAVGVHRATIYNEMKRGGEPYRAEVAQRAL